MRTNLRAGFASHWTSEDPTDKDGLKCLAFGPDGSYMVVPCSSVLCPFWKGEAAEKFCSNKKQVDYLAFCGPDQHYVLYSDGSWEHKLPSKLVELIETEGVSWISFGSDSYILESAEGELRWNNIPEQLAVKLQEWRRGLVSVSLGKENTYCAIFKSGPVWSHGVPELLDTMLKTKTVPDTHASIETFDAVWLSAYDDRFYLQYNGGAAYWDCGECSQFTRMMQCHDTLRPQEIFYSNESIAPTFSDGRSIYDAAQGLNQGSLHITDFPLIQVFRIGSSLFSRNNRRLWAFRNSGVDWVPVIYVHRPSYARGLKNEKRFTYATLADFKQAETCSHIAAARSSLRRSNTAGANGTQSGVG